MHAFWLVSRHDFNSWSDDEEIFAEQTVKLLLIWVFRTQKLSRSIMFNCDLQFILIVWKSLCLRLNIKIKLFTNYHLQINDQTERVNQNVKWYLWSYCSYMQDDWFIWLSTSYSRSSSLRWRSQPSSTMIRLARRFVISPSINSSPHSNAL